MTIETGIILLAATLLVISAAAVIAPKLRVPAPLILVVAGIGVSWLPFVPKFAIDPNVILLLLLPPLLYAAAAAVPIANFRRDFGAINGLSILLVIVTALALGGLFAWFIPDFGFAWGVAVGAVLSPTDAVATSIIKERGAPSRVAVILDGEGLLNDASAIVVLKAALVAAAAGFSFWPTVGSFVYSIAVAVSIGAVVARISLAIRSRIRDKAVNTILSFATPFIAAIPVEMLHGSGLVAAVVAGLVKSAIGPRLLPPGHRLSDSWNWATIGIVLEGIVFLTMGLQLADIVAKVAVEPHGLRRGLAIAALALVIALAIRAVYVAGLLWAVRRRAERWRTADEKVARMRESLERGREKAVSVGGWQFEGARMVRRIAVQLADIDYLMRHPLGGAETIIIIWAGMRGAVTVAAVQLLPPDAPHRPLLVFVAFAMAAMSLLVQGGTIGALATRLLPGGENGAAAEAEKADRRKIHGLLDQVAARTKRDGEASETEHRRALLQAQRTALLNAADHGLLEAEAFNEALLSLDASELMLDLREEPAA